MMEGIDFRKQSNGDILEIKYIDKKIAKDIVIKNHYSHSWYHTFGIINFGIYRNSELLGVAVFGHLKVPKSYSKICSNIGQNQIIELNRLWLDDKLGKNSESIFIGLCFKKIKIDYPHIKLIQSFADGRLGHGTIYQATNFNYYGKHYTEFFENEDTGRIMCEQVFHTSNRPIVITNNLEFINGNFKKFKTPTYRYIYFLDSNYKKYCLLKEEKYPKDKNSKIYIEYEKDINKNLRFIDNAIKLMFYKFGKNYFRFTYKNNKYLYTKDMYENGINLISLLSYPQFQN